MKHKKRPKFRCVWALACSIAVLPAVLLYFIFKYAAKSVVIAVELFFYLFSPHCRDDESLGNLFSRLIEQVFSDDM